MGQSNAETIKVRLNTVERIEDFVCTVSQYPEELDLTSGRCTVNAKSIMGVFCLNLTNDIELAIHADKARAKAIEKDLEKFVA